MRSVPAKRGVLERRVAAPALACALTWLPLVVPTSLAYGQPSAAPAPVPSPEGGQDRARALFIEGRELIAQGRPADACERLKRSHELALAIGTLLNLGLCHRRSGLLASAERYYQRAHELAVAAGDSERGALARTELGSLQTAVSRLTLEVSVSPDTPIEIWVDGERQSPEHWGSPISLDAGPHVISVTAAGRPPWRATVVARDGVARTLRVPVPEKHNATSAAGGPSARLQAKTSGSDFNTRHVATLGLGAAGLAGLGVGAVYAVLARGAFDDSGPHCTARDVCDVRGVGLRDDAQAHAMRATVSLSIGAALLAASAIWFALPDERPMPDKASMTASVGRGMVRADVTGSF